MWASTQEPSLRAPAKQSREIDRKGWIASSLTLLAMTTKLHASLALSLSHPHFDQPRSACRDKIRKRLVELVGARHRAALHAHAFGQTHKVDRRTIDLQHVHRALARRAGADAVEFAAQDLIDAVGEDD